MFDNNNMVNPAGGGVHLDNTKSRSSVASHVHNQRKASPRANNSGVTNQKLG